MAPGWRITTERACAGRNAPTWPAAAISSPGRLFLGERGVRFDPYVRPGGRPFLARLINDFARRIGLRCLFAHLCHQALKRSEHLFVFESDAAFSRPSFRRPAGVGNRLRPPQWHASAGHLPEREGSLVAAVTVNVLGRSPRGQQWCRATVYASLTFVIGGPPGGHRGAAGSSQNVSGLPQVADPCPAGS